MKKDHTTAYYWLLLFIGIGLEVTGTTLMRALAENDPFLGLLIVSLAISVSYFFTSRAMLVIPAGLAYAVWSGAGMAIIALLSWLFFAEPMPPLKLLGLFVVIWSMVTLNLARAAESKKNG